MFRFVGKFSKLTFKRKTYSKTLAAALERQMRQAARAFLRAVITTPVPIYTGMARGSLKPLGRFLRVAIPLSGKDPRARFFPNKTPEAGAALSSFSFTKGKGFNPRFRLSVGVEHFKFLDIRGHPKVGSAPWGSFERGQNAFREYLRENLVRKIPNVIGFISTTETPFVIK